MGEKIEVRCPSCQVKIRVGIEFIGKKARCPKCWNIFEIAVSQKVELPLAEFEEIEQNPQSLSEIPEVPRVKSFGDVIEELISRQSVLVTDVKEAITAYPINKFFWITKSPTLLITEKVRDAMVSSLKQGKPMYEAIDLISKIGDFTKAYSQTVYRTNLSSAYTAALFKKAKQPHIEAIAPAMIYYSFTDSHTRPNHAAANHLIASVRDPIWKYLAPPLGFNCRCSINSVDKYTLQEKGLIDKNGKMKRAIIPVGAGPDKGFSTEGNCG